MTFSEQLNKYIQNLGCSSQEIAKASGLSASVISRYRNGDRTPSLRSTQLKQLSQGLSDISNSSIPQEDIYNTLATCLNDISIDYEQLSKNFNQLVSVLNISVADLSRSIGYDPSFLSKIRTGNRAPSKPKDFVEAVCDFVVTKFVSSDNKKTVATLINCSANDLKDKSHYLSKLINWFSTNAVQDNQYVNDFLNNLDNFDLNEYIKAIKFDELKVPNIPFYKPVSKSYYGIEEMKKGELDFFKATVFSKATEPVFMCSDMPMEDMAKDVDFGKKWMFAIAMTIKKGLHLNVIHNINRPFNEMMLGLESWIPIYMTGQVSPYYLKNVQNNIYCHLNYVSGSVALEGECINGYHNNGKYILTANKKDVTYYKTKSDDLLRKATPLMKVYRNNSQSDFNKFMDSSLALKGKRRRILSSLPLHTISNKLLDKILFHNNLSEEDCSLIRATVSKQREAIQSVLKNNIVEDEFVEFSKEDFESSPVSLFLADIFYDKKIYYTYDEYLEHLKAAKSYAKKNKNYKINTNNVHAFKNIQIFILEKNWIIISKGTSPSIHFVIHHPKLRDAIENFIPPVVE